MVLASKAPRKKLCPTIYNSMLLKGEFEGNNEGLKSQNFLCVCVGGVEGGRAQVVRGEEGEPAAAIGEACALSLSQRENHYQVLIP